MPKVSELKNIKNFGYKQFAIWGMVGALILFLYSLIALICIRIIPFNSVDLILNALGIVFGILYMILGIFAVIKVVQKQEGNFWAIFLVAAIVTILAPLAWFPSGGIAISLIAGILYLVYYILEK